MKEVHEMFSNIVFLSLHLKTDPAQAGALFNWIRGRNGLLKTAFLLKMKMVLLCKHAFID